MRSLNTECIIIIIIRSSVVSDHYYSWYRIACSTDKKVRPVQTNKTVDSTTKQTVIVIEQRTEGSVPTRRYQLFIKGRNLGNFYNINAFINV